MRRFPLVAVLAVAVGCVSVPMATAEQDRSAKEFRTTPGKANLYVFRDESFGAGVKMGLQLDGRVLGDTGAKTFHLTTVSPGPHVLISKAENDEKLQFTAEPGQNVYVWQEVKMGVFMARTRLEQMREADAKPRIMECSLAANELDATPPAPAPLATSPVPRS